MKHFVNESMQQRQLIWKRTKKEKYVDKYLKDKKYRKVKYHCHCGGYYRGAAHSIYNLKI